MYGIFTYIYHENQPNVGKYTIHGSYGNCTMFRASSFSIEGIKWQNTVGGFSQYFPGNEDEVWYST